MSGRNQRIRATTSGTVVFVMFVLSLAGRITAKPIYLDAGAPIEARVEDLLSRMTLEEKIGQMNMPCMYWKQIGWGLEVGRTGIFGKLSKEVREQQMEGCRKLTAGTHTKGLAPFGGFFTLSDRILYEGAGQQAKFLNELQEIATTQTRLKIPLLQIEEGTHGLMCAGGTIFPEGLAIGSSWNMDLVKKIYEAAAREGRAIGVHQLCTLVIEPNRDARMGRNEEGYSEDPYLCSCIAKAIVEGCQGWDVSAKDKVVAVLCHYPGQSQPVGGLERGAMEISERTLREVFLPPWVTGIKECGALGVMATYPAIDGVPVHGSEKILTDILRGELRFDGLVLSEGTGINTIVYEGVAADQKQAGEMALKAGVDVGISLEEAYMDALAANVNDGTVPMELVDRAVRRILKMKFRQGLFENPFVDVEYAARVSHNQAHQELALQAAREGIVLLKNEKNILPLSKNIKSIAVIGPVADADEDQLGDYSPHNLLHDIVTPLEGIKRKVPQAKVRYVKGCEVIKGKLDEISQAQAAAKEAEVAVVVVGESRDTDGEGKDVADFDLTGLQQKLVEAVYETGTPTIVVLINGRPLSIRWIAENVPGIVEAWNCGEKGGDAIADVLFGDYNPSGRLPITVPRHVGQLPVYYNYRPSRSAHTKYVNMSGRPLYEFGYGLSYTKFEYSNISIEPQKTGPGAGRSIKVDVQNVGDRAGQEVVQLYINDVVSSVTTPAKELKAFRKVELAPGEKKTVEFVVGPYELSLLDRNLNRVVEPGTFEVMVGASSKDIRLRGNFECQ